jgi:hypothetical protein
MRDCEMMINFRPVRGARRPRRRLDGIPVISRKATQMIVRKVTTLLCGVIATAGLITGCGSGDNISTETNLANIPLPTVNAKGRQASFGKGNHANKSKFRAAHPPISSPRLLPNGKPA